MLIFEGDIPVLNCVFEETQLISKGCYSSEDRDLNPLFLSAGSTTDFEDQDSGLVTIFLVPTAIIISLIAYPGSRAGCQAYVTFPSMHTARNLFLPK